MTDTNLYNPFVLTNEEIKDIELEEAIMTDDDWVVLNSDDDIKNFIKKCHLDAVKEIEKQKKLAHA